MAIGEEEMAMEKIQISGATLASLLQRFSSSPGDIEGLLFGHVTTLSPSHFSDDATSSPPPPPTSIATVTSFIITTTSATSSSPSATSSIIGRFSGRRRSPLRPSLRDSLNLTLPSSASCRVFLLLASPAPSPNNYDNATTTIHTHEYKAFQFYRQNNNLVPRTLEAVNIGPGFRNHYGSFSPTSPFPVMTPFENVGFMTDEKNEKNDGMGLDVAVLDSLMGREAAEYTGRVEDVYKGMLERLDQLAMMVHDSSSKVFHLENQNMKLRFKIAGLE